MKNYVAAAYIESVVFADSTCFHNLLCAVWFATEILLPGRSESCKVQLIELLENRGKLLG